MTISVGTYSIMLRYAFNLTINEETERGFIVPVIAIVSPKGGAGKSTLANVVATTFYASGASVAIVDCDKSKAQYAWKYGNIDRREHLVKTGCDIPVTGDVGERNIFEAIDQHRKERQIVIVDTEGTASLVMSRAIIRADLVLIPVKPSPNDIDTGALKAIRLIREEEMGLQRKIHYACVMVETPGSSNFKTRLQKEFEQTMAEEGVPILSTDLVKREAYKSIFYERVALHELNPSSTPSLQKALDNASELTGEIFQRIKETREAA